MLNFEDPAVVKGAKSFILLFMAGMLAVALFGVALASDWYFVQGQGETGMGDPTLSGLVGFFPALAGPKVSEILNTTAVFGISIPLVLGKVCFETLKRPGRKSVLILSPFGRKIALSLVAALFLSLVSYFLVQAEDWGRGHLIGEDGVAKVQDWIKAVMRTSATYLAALAGVKVSQ